MQRLFEAGTKRHYKKGDTIWQPEDDGKCFFIVISGRVKAFTLSANGDENIYLIYGPDDIFPLTGLINKQALPISYVAITDCEALVIPTDVAERILRTYPESSFEMLQRVIRLMSVYVARLNNLEFKYARERVAYRLLLLAQRFGEQHKSTIRLPRFNQQEIAGSINVSRELKRFERLGLLKYTTDHLIILDSDGLHKQISPRGERLFIDDL